MYPLTQPLAIKSPRLVDMPFISIDLSWKWKFISRQKELSVNNYLLERIDVTIIYPIYFYELSLYYLDMKVLIFMQISKPESIHTFFQLYKRYVFIY